MTSKANHMQGSLSAVSSLLRVSDTK